MALSGFTIELTPDGDSMANLRAMMARIEAQGKNLNVPFRQFAQWMIREAKRVIYSRAPEWGPYTYKTRASLTSRVNAHSVVVGSNAKWAAMLHEGGTVQPRGHPYLAIPVLPHLRKNAVWPRDIPRDSMKFVPNARIVIGSHSWVGPALVRREPEVSDGESKARGRRKGTGLARHGEVMFALVKQARIKGIFYLAIPWQRGGRVVFMIFLVTHYRKAAPPGKPG